MRPRSPRRSEFASWSVRCTSRPQHSDKRLSAILLKTASAIVIAGRQFPSQVELLVIWLPPLGGDGMTSLVIRLTQDAFISTLGMERLPCELFCKGIRR